MEVGVDVGDASRTGDACSGGWWIVDNGGGGGVERGRERARSGGRKKGCFGERLDALANLNFRLGGFRLLAVLDLLHGLAHPLLAF
jgi:hypothetical protein